MTNLLLFGLLAAPGALAVKEADLPAKTAAIRAEADADRSGTFEGKGGVKLFFEVHPAAHEKAALVLLNGRTESTRKYGELYHDLKAMGFTVYTYDHRGQGRSGRLLDDPRKLHVGKFQDYVDDVQAFLDQVVLPAHPKSLHLVGHSMGGLIGALYLEQHQGTFRSASLLSPALALHLVKPDLEIEDQVCKGNPTAYLHGPEDNEDVPFENNAVTSSRNRFDFVANGKKSHADEVVGGITRNWLCEMVMAGEKARRHPAEITTPTLLLVARDDHNTRIEDSKAFCKAVKGCRVQEIPAKHNLLIEKDGPRDRALKAVAEFVRKRR